MTPVIWKNSITQIEGEITRLTLADTVDSSAIEAGMPHLIGDGVFLSAGIGQPAVTVIPNYGYGMRQLRSPNAVDDVPQLLAVPHSKEIFPCDYGVRLGVGLIFDIVVQGDLGSLGVSGNPMKIVVSSSESTYRGWDSPPAAASTDSAQLDSDLKHSKSEDEVVFVAGSDLGERLE